MKKRLSLFLALCLALALLPSIALAADAPGLSHFTRSTTYTPGQFSDVTSGDWFASSVQSACELGLMKGQSDTAFGPNNTLTLAEAVVMASRLHSIYQTGTEDFQTASPWYQAYVDYATANQILTSSGGDYSAPVNRADFASLLAKALPAAELAGVNTIEDGAIPDLDGVSAEARQAVYTLYRAGILTGSDSKGSFQPASTINRAEAAAIITRMADAGQRKTGFTLSEPQVTMYAADGRTNSVPASKVEAYAAVGWYTQPPVTLYAADGRTTMVSGDKVDAYTAVGWSAEPPVTLYASGGRTISVLPSQVDAYLAVGWSLTEPAALGRNTPIRIYSHPKPEINSVGGVSFYLYWNSHSDKTIKYIHFDTTPYNRVWDVLQSEIGRKSTVDCYLTGPFDRISANTNWRDEDAPCFILTSWDGVEAPNMYIVHEDSTYGKDNKSVTPSLYDDVFMRHYWDCVWYNSDTAYLVISKVTIEYMDGTKTVLSGSDLEACFY